MFYQKSHNKKLTMITSIGTPKKPSQCSTDWIWTRTSPPRRKLPRSKDGDVDGDDIGDSEDDDDDGNVKVIRI